MIKGLGTDLVEVNRMTGKIKKDSFLKLAFTENEIAYCKSKKYPSQHFAARFAAKEAYMKAIGKGWSKEANFKEIEIQNNEHGAPNLKLKGATLDFFHQSGFNQILLSMSHTDTMATATVIVTAENSLT